MKQTAVEWLVEKLDQNFDYVADTLIEKALEMEKQQNGYSEEDLKYAFEQGELNSNICYRRTFKNVLEILQFKK